MADNNPGRQYCMSYPQRQWNTTLAPSFTNSNFRFHVIEAAQDFRRQIPYIRISYNETAFDLTDSHISQGGLTISRNISSNADTYPLGSVCACEGTLKLSKPALVGVVGNDNTTTFPQDTDELIGETVYILITVDTSHMKYWDSQAGEYKEYEEDLYASEGQTERDVFNQHFVITEVTNDEYSIELKLSDDMVYLDFGYNDLHEKRPSASVDPLFQTIWGQTNYYKSSPTLVFQTIEQWLDTYYGVESGTSRPYLSLFTTLSSSRIKVFNNPEDTSATISHYPYIYYGTGSTTQALANNQMKWAMARPDGAESMNLREFLGYYAALSYGNFFINDAGYLDFCISGATIDENNASRGWLLDGLLDKDKVFSYTVKNRYKFTLIHPSKHSSGKGRIYYCTGDNPLYLGQTGRVRQFDATWRSYGTAGKAGWGNPISFEADIAPAPYLTPDTAIEFPGWLTKSSSDSTAVITGVTFTLNGLTHIECDINPSTNYFYDQT